MRRWKVPGFCRGVELLDRVNHALGFRVGILCDLYDWGLGLTWREARSRATPARTRNSAEHTVRSTWERKP
jgi:hypothetical protein